MADLKLNQALTHRSRLLGRTSGDYKGEVATTVLQGRMVSNDDSLGSVRKKMFASTPVHFAIGKKSPRGFESKQDYETRTKADSSSISQLMKNSEELYEKILQANADKKVTINGKEMSVAFAIVYRDIFLPRKKDQLTILKFQYQKILTEVDVINQRAQAEVDQIIQTSAQSEKPNAEESKKAYEFHMSNREAKIIDPLGIKDIISKLQTEIEIIENDLQTQLYNNNISTDIDWSPDS